MTSVVKNYVPTQKIIEWESQVFERSRNAAEYQKLIDTLIDKLLQHWVDRLLAEPLTSYRFTPSEKGTIEKCRKFFNKMIQIAKQHQNSQTEIEVRKTPFFRRVGNSVQNLTT